MIEKTEEVQDGGKGFDSREDIMDSLIANRNQEFEDETGEKLPEVTEDEDTDGKTKIIDDETPDGLPDGTNPRKLFDENEAGVVSEDEEFELVVDGEKKTMKKADVISLAQKNLAADKRLQEAELDRQAAKELLKTAQEAEPVVDTGPADEEAEEDIKEKRSAYLHAMNYGEPDEQEQAMIDYETAVKSSAAPQEPTNAKDLAASIKAEIKEELTGDQIRDRFALPESQGGFGDIMADEDLKELCFLRIDKAIADGSDHSTWKTYQEIAEKVRDKFITETKRQPGNKITMQDKKNRKKAIDNLDTVSDSSQSTVPEKSPESSKLSRSDTIARMATGRPGQQIY